MVSGCGRDHQKGGPGAQMDTQVLGDFWQEMGHECPQQKKVLRFKSRSEEGEDKKY